MMNFKYKVIKGHNLLKQNMEDLKKRRSSFYWLWWVYTLLQLLSQEIRIQ